MPTIGELVDRAIDRADFTGSSFPVTDTMIQYVNAELARLHNLLAGIYEDYLAKTSEIEITTDAQAYDLPGDLLKIRKLYLLDSSGERSAILKPCTLDDLELSEQSINATDNSDLGYLINGMKIHLNRKPLSDGTLELWYIPQHRYLEDRNDVINYAIPVEWTDFVVEGAAARLAEKAEMDPTPYRARQAELKLELEGIAHNRDASGPTKVRDVRRRFG